MGLPAISANERALLNTIRYAEGTWHGGGTQGYGTMFGGGQFDWSKGHPNRVVRSGGYASAAAGAYQFMPDTWGAVSRQLGLKDFSPDSQDRAALQLIRNRGVDPSKPITTDALARLAPEWASLPTASGRSYYKQPVKSHRELFSFYGTHPNATVGGSSSGGSPSGGSPTGGIASGGGSMVAPPVKPLQIPTVVPQVMPAMLDLSPSGASSPALPGAVVATATPETNSAFAAKTDPITSAAQKALQNDQAYLDAPSAFVRPLKRRTAEGRSRMAGDIINQIQSLLAA